MAGPKGDASKGHHAINVAEIRKGIALALPLFDALSSHTSNLYDDVVVAVLRAVNGDDEIAALVEAAIHQDQKLQAAVEASNR